MGPKRLTWPEKATAARKKRGWSARQLAKRMGEKERNVRNWLSGSSRPINEVAVVARVAAALEVNEDWLRDGTEGDPPRAPKGTVPLPDDLMRRMSPKARRLIYALADDATTEHLYACLELYERARRQ